ncbi:hypothetical protein NM688_g6363 [Phlebia brevispora]|uniref:Uncharacterized protein n=1 Tax=Phlebia brevispora TaxID=194682 RepID=A0ACC1SGQ9_9APHY|nr:hypothetical protein NM688_g6363 [Phlebia brevispora]
MGLHEWADRLAENPVTANWVYDVVLFWFKLVVSIFFREIRPRGAFHIPREGPVIFAAAPHHNQVSVPRPAPGWNHSTCSLSTVSGLATSAPCIPGNWKKSSIPCGSEEHEAGCSGFLREIAAQYAVPVVRATDEAKPAIGRILLSKSDPCLVIGVGTRFLSELAPRMQIMLPKSVGSVVAEIVEVLSDSELRIKREFGGESGKGTAIIREKLQQQRDDGQKEVGFEFKKMPHIDQQETYHHVYKCLNEGGCIVIFPEGASEHSASDYQYARPECRGPSGVSFMALGAMANNPGLKVKIVPVGLSYFHPHKFRSRAVVEFGSAMDVPEQYVDMFKEGGPQKREAVGKLLDLIYDGLKIVTIRAPDYDTLMLIQAARRLYVTPGQHLTLSQVVELNKRFIESYMAFKDEPKVQKLRRDVLKYNRVLRDLGLRDHQVPSARRASWRTLGLFTYRVLLLTVWSVLALPGVVLSAPVFIAAKVISRKKAKEALAASVVKVAARDVIGSWKVLISLGLAPLLYGFYAFLATLVMVKANAPFALIMWTPFIVIAALPFIGFAALKFGEAGMDVLKSLRPLVVALVPGQQRHLEELKARRARLAKELEDVINEYAPKLYSDFDETKNLVHSTSLPPPSNKAGLPQRTSGAEGQGQLLVHPMTWLDERLFGWSRSANIGRDEWASSAQDSKSTDPEVDFSDDEIGDYDDLLGYLDGKNAPGAARSRGERNSYADLQKLRRSSNAQVTERHPVLSGGATDLAPNPSASEDGLHNNELVAEHSDIVYDSALLFWKTVTNIFFREIRPRGAFNIPHNGPVIFVAAPHHNQFLDPLLLALQVYRETRRKVQFLIAAKSMTRKAVGFFASLMSSIPVSRAADGAKEGTGRVTISDEDPCLVKGYDTKFLSEFKPKMQIMLPKTVNYALAEVVEVISDTELRIKKEFGGESGKGTARVREKLKELEAEGVEGLEFKRLPHVDQAEMYHYVYECLRHGGCIGIFPEGGSHDRTDLLPLKAGVSLMALGAMANHPEVKVKIVPVGLSYFHAHRFRSRAVVEFGSALDVPEELIEMYKQGGAQKRDAVGKLLDLIYDGLKTVTIRAPDYDTLMMIQAARRLYKTPGQHLTLGQVVELNKRFLEGYLHFKDEPKVQKLRENVLKYNRLLRDLGLRDHQVPGAQPASWKTLGLLLYRLILLLVWTVLALPGVILAGPVFLTASIISRKKAKEALAASTVKVAGRDVLATWKILVSLGIAPLLYGLYAFLATWIMIRANAPMSWRIWTPIIVMVSLPFIAYAALKFGEAGMDVLKSLRPLVIALVPGQQRTLNRVKDMREELANELADVINEFGPKVFEDFNEVSPETNR